MAEGSDVAGLIRRLTEANGRLYRGWMELSLEYLRGLTEILDPEAESSAPSAEPEAPASALILEGVGGEKASGAFLITNDLGRTLKCEPMASSFAGPDGETARPKVSFEPSSVQLKPGEQRVVRAHLNVGKRLPPGVAYTGTIGIKGMTGFEVPVVLRRLDEAELSPIERAAAPSKSTSRTKPRRKAAATKAGQRSKKKKRQQ